MIQTVNFMVLWKEIRDFNIDKPANVAIMIVM